MEMLYGCPFEKITFLSRIDTNSGFGNSQFGTFDPVKEFEIFCDQIPSFEVL